MRQDMYHQPDLVLALEHSQRQRRYILQHHHQDLRQDHLQDHHLDTPLVLCHHLEDPVDRRHHLQDHHRLQVQVHLVRRMVPSSRVTIGVNTK